MLGYKQEKRVFDTKISLLPKRQLVRSLARLLTQKSMQKRLGGCKIALADCKTNGACCCRLEFVCAAFCARRNFARSLTLKRHRVGANTIVEDAVLVKRVGQLEHLKIQLNDQIL